MRSGAWTCRCCYCKAVVTAHGAMIVVTQDMLLNSPPPRSVVSRQKGMLPHQGHWLFGLNSRAWCIQLLQGRH